MGDLMDINALRKTGEYRAAWLAYANLCLAANKNLVRVTCATELPVLTLAVDNPEIWLVVADCRDCTIELYSLDEKSVYYDRSLNSLLAGEAVIYAAAYQKLSEHFETMVSAPVDYDTLYKRLSREYMSTERDVTRKVDDECIRNFIKNSLAMQKHHS